MPIDEAAGGCLEVVFRVLFEILSEGLIRGFWFVCQCVGAATVWFVTFGQIWLMEESENLAGCVGLAEVTGLIYWLYQHFSG